MSDQDDLTKKLFRTAQSALRGKVSPDLSDRIEHSFQEWIQDSAPPQDSLLKKFMRWFWFPVVAVAGYQAYDKILVPYWARQNESVQQANTSPGTSTIDPTKDIEKAKLLNNQVATKNVQVQDAENTRKEEDLKKSSAKRLDSRSRFREGTLEVIKNEDSGAGTKLKDKSEVAEQKTVTTETQLPIITPTLTRANWKFESGRAEIAIQWDKKAYPPSTLFQFQYRGNGTQTFDSLGEPISVSDDVRIPVDLTSDIVSEDSEIRAQACSQGNCTSWSNLVPLKSQALALSNVRIRFLVSDTPPYSPQLSIRWKRGMQPVPNFQVEMIAEDLITHTTQAITGMALDEKAKFTGFSEYHHYKVQLKTSRTMPGSGGVVIHWNKPVILCQGDVNQDGIVDDTDKEIISNSSYPMTPANPNEDPFNRLIPGDIDGSLSRGPEDVSIWTQRQGACPQIENSP